MGGSGENLWTKKLLRWDSKGSDMSQWSFNPVIDLIYLIHWLINSVLLLCANVYLWWIRLISFFRLPFHLLLSISLFSLPPSLPFCFSLPPWSVCFPSCFFGKHHPCVGLGVLCVLLIHRWKRLVSVLQEPLAGRRRDREGFGSCWGISLWFKGSSLHGNNKRNNR